MPALDIGHHGIQIKTDTHIVSTLGQQAERATAAFDLGDHDIDRVVNPGKLFVFAF
jgi:hypothetical protein